MPPSIDGKLKDALRVEHLALPARPKVKAITWAWYEEMSAEPASPDDTAIRVKVLLAAPTPDKPPPWKVLKPIERAIRRAVADVDPNIFPYIDFLKESGVAA